MRDRMILRHDVVKAIRDSLSERGLPRDRDADHDPLDARGGARLPRAEPARARLLVRAAAVAPALQAAADDGRDGALLPDRALLPRRGLPRRPPARVHAARHGDGVRRGGGRPRHRRPAAAAGARGRRHRGVAPDRARDLRRRAAALRLGPARPAAGSRDRGPLRRVRRRASSRCSPARSSRAASCARSRPAASGRAAASTRSPRRPSRSARRGSPGRWSRRTAAGARRSRSSCPRRRSARPPSGSARSPARRS